LFRFVTRQLRESQISSEVHFRREDNLSGVIREVLRDVRDGLDTGHTKSLDEVNPHKLVASHAFQNATGYSNRASEPGEEQPARKWPAVRKFLISLAPVRLASQA